MLYIAKVVKSVDENSCNFNFVTRSCNINKIILAHNLFLARDTSWRDSAWSLLDSQLLVVLVDSVGFINNIGTLFLANHARSKFFLSFILVSSIAWSLQISTFTSEENLLILRENTCSFGYNTSEFDECIQMDMTKLSEFVLYWKASNSHKNLCVN